jgi:hypothetical protein
MNIDTFKQLLEAYGATESRWPSQSRAAAITLLAASADARALQDQHALLDQALDRYQVDENLTRLRSDILAQLPQNSLLDRLLDWLIPTHIDLQAVIRPAMVATLPLILGVALGSSLNLDMLDTSADWEDEIYLMALVEDDTEFLP